MAESYKKGADMSGTQSKLVHLIDLEFYPIPTFGYRVVSEFEPDLQKIQQDILAADHLVMVRRVGESILIPAKFTARQNLKSPHRPHPVAGTLQAVVIGIAGGEVKIEGIVVTVLG